MKKILNFIKESRIEVVNRTSWPGFTELMANSIAILVTLFLVALFIFGVDAASSGLMRLIYGFISG